jgi:transcriptional regulator with XRE-family HTH domain
MQVYSSAQWRGATDSSTILGAMAPTNPSDQTEIARRLRLTREADGYTQAALVRRLGGDLTPQKWNNYERCRDLIPIPFVVVLAQKLAWSTDWILWGNPALLSAKLATAIERLERKEAERPESAKRPSRRK